MGVKIKKSGKKSHVGIGITLCPICLAKEESILLDKKLQDSLEPETFIGWSLCKDHAEKHAEGYIALVACEEPVSKIQDAQRTGDIVHIKREVFRKMFNVKEEVSNHEFVFCEQKVVEQLKTLQKK